MRSVFYFYTLSGYIVYGMTVRDMPGKETAARFHTPRRRFYIFRADPGFSFRAKPAGGGRDRGGKYIYFPPASCPFASLRLAPLSVGRTGSAFNARSRLPFLPRGILFLLSAAARLKCKQSVNISVPDRKQDAGRREMCYHTGNQTGGGFFPRDRRRPLTKNSCARRIRVIK